MSGCYCDYDGPSAFSQTRQKARKAHACDECRGAIASGEEYERTWGVWDGEVSTFKRCTDCTALCEWIVTHVPCYCDRFRELHASAVECLDEYESDCPGISKEVRDRIAAIKLKRRAALSLAEAKQ